MSMTYEITYDGPDGKVLTKQFSDLDKAREFAQGKVCQGGPARLAVVEDEGHGHRRAKDDEPDPPPKHRPRPRPKPKAKTRTAVVHRRRRPS